MGGFGHKKGPFFLAAETQARSFDAIFGTQTKDDKGSKCDRGLIGGIQRAYGHVSRSNF